MNIKAEILKEHSKEHALLIAKYACSNSKYFKVLIECYKSEDYRLAQRAAWSVSWAARTKPEMIMPFVKDLVEMLNKPNVHDAVKRNAVRVLQEINIPEQFHGEVMNSCFTFIENPVTPAAIKAFSLTTLFNLSNIYPDIKPELKLIIEERMNNETAAFKSRGKKILSKL
ncbi:MAG: hypothetical protein C0459_09090 [Chitinophaga sp.]|jgi:hypothetical protein|nr:hypothetical protein [Chitinophaga sp.]